MVDFLADDEGRPRLLTFGTSRIALLETLFLHTPMGIAIFDQDLVLQRCNPIWAELVGRYTTTSTDQMVPGAHLFDLAPDS